MALIFPPKNYYKHLFIMFASLLFFLFIKNIGSVNVLTFLSIRNSALICIIKPTSYDLPTHA